jgi:hypothetical protein
MNTHLEYGSDGLCSTSESGAEQGGAVERCMPAFLLHPTPTPVGGGVGGAVEQGPGGAKIEVEQVEQVEQGGAGHGR